MTHWRKFNKRMDPGYLYAEDIGPPGTKLDVQIVGAGGAKIKNPGGSKECTALDLGGFTKRLGLGATNAKAIAQLFGSGEIESWRGWITLVVINTMCRDPTSDSKDMVPTDVIRIAPTQPASSRQQAPRSQAGGEHPLVARFDVCSSRKDFAALDAEMRADWESIPKGAARTAVSEAFDRAKARLRKTDEPTNTPPPDEQAEILRREASEGT